MHSVQQTPCGKYAVVSPTGEVVGEVEFESLALSVADDLNRGTAVETVAPSGRWDGGKR